MGRLIPCKVCNKDFVATASRQWICSAECRRARRRALEAGSDLPGLPPPTAECRICGKSFQKNRSQVLCSRECLTEARRQKDAQKWASATPEQRRKVYDRNKGQRETDPDWAKGVDQRKWARTKMAIANDPKKKEERSAKAKETYARHREAIFARRKARMAALTETELAERIERGRESCRRHRERVRSNPQIAQRYREAQAEGRRRRREGNLSLDFARLQEEARARLAGEKSNQARCCIICQKQFVGKRHSAKVCSPECRRARHNQLVHPLRTVACVVCGTLFETKAARTICSPECRRARDNKGRREKRYDNSSNRGGNTNTDASNA